MSIPFNITLVSYYDEYITIKGTQEEKLKIPNDLPFDAAWDSENSSRKV